MRRIRKEIQRSPMDPPRNSHVSVDELTFSPYLKRVNYFSNSKNKPRRPGETVLHEQKDILKGNKLVRLPKIESKKEPESPALQGKGSRLQPIERIGQINVVFRTRAGSMGKQTKINQDAAVIELGLPFGIRLFGVCDGHGVNGHVVSAFIRTQLPKNLKLALKKLHEPPEHRKMQEIFCTALSKTNQELLTADINTDLSGSTVVMVTLYQDRLACFNVGDSRAVLAQLPTPNDTEEVRTEDQDSTKIPLSRSKKMSLATLKSFDASLWKVVELSSDQKPERPDERERILKAGGRVECQKTETGQEIGPLRVWMRDIQMPGLAMTRSFGDKAGIRAGTNGEPEVKQWPLTPEDKFLIVASDGVWEYLSSEDVVRLVGPDILHGGLAEAAERIVRVSSECWQRVSLSRDDITVVIVALPSVTA